MKRRGTLDFEAINRAAIDVAPAILNRFLPDGRLEGHEFTARNPCRADRSLGSFRINIRTGKWSDFATGDKGGDFISLTAYVAGLKQGEAARALAEMLGIDGGAR